MKLKRKSKKIYTLIVLCVFLLSFALYYSFLVHPVIKRYSTAKINDLTERTLNLAVSNVINTSLNYDSLINISYAPTGEISMISANQYAINTIMREIVKNAMHLMENLGKECLQIPIGTFSGISILSGRGPKINVQTMPISVVCSNFNTNFQSVGINNTLHQLYLDVFAKVRIILPLKDCIINSKQSILISEGVIVGKVPNVYFSGSNNKINETFDLIP